MQALAQLLDEFAHVRTATLEELRTFNLQPADLDRRGRHPNFGPVELSVKNLPANSRLSSMRRLPSPCSFG